MRPPDAPFLEFGFYFADRPEADAFARLVTTLSGMGAKFTGEASAHYGPDVRNSSFASITDDPLPGRITLEDPELLRCLTDPGTRLIQVYMEDATGIVPGVAEIVTYLSISPVAARIDRHPMAIWTEGELFSGASRQRLAKGARKAGRLAYQRFRALVEALRPAYAAITVEHHLQCPADLRRDPRSLAFRDFYISRTYLGPSNLIYLQELFSGAFIVSLGDGVYVSCNKEFNPKNRSLDSEYAESHSVKVAKLIGSLS